MGHSLLLIGGTAGVRRALADAGADLSETPIPDYVLSATEDTPASAALALWSRRAEGELLISATRAERSWHTRALRFWLGMPYFDYRSALRLYRGSALRRCGASAARPLEALVLLHRDGYRVREIPAEARPSLRGPGPLALWRLRRLRFAPRAADDDERAFGRRPRFRNQRLRRRHDFVMRYLEVDVPLLDVGCGSGRLIQSISNGTGVDVDLAKLRYLRSRAPAAVAGTVESLPFRDESFPQAVCTGIVTPSDDGSSLSELHRVLRPGGTLVMGGSRRDANGLRERLDEAGFRVAESRRPSRDEILLRAIRR